MMIVQHIPRAKEKAATKARIDLARPMSLSMSRASQRKMKRQLSPQMQSHSMVKKLPTKMHKSSMTMKKPWKTLNKAKKMRTAYKR